MTRHLMSIILLPGLFLLLSCSSAREGSVETRTAEDELRRLEEEFDPSEYNSSINAGVEKKSAQTPSPVTDVEITNPPLSELVQGFRVQLLATSSIDEAAQQKERAEEIFPDEWFYLVYDPPSYKIRGGNFPTRFEADRFLRTVRENGFRDAWVVPDRVQKTPPPRSALPPIEEIRKETDPQ